MILDLIAVIAILCFVIIGVKRGLVKTLFGTLSFTVAILLTIVVLPHAAKYTKDTFVGEYIYEKTQISITDENTSSEFFDFIETFADTSDFTSEISKLQTDISQRIGDFVIKALCAVLLFVIFTVSLKLLCKLIDAIFKLPGLKSINKFGGFIAGLVNAYIFLNVAACLLMLYISASPGSNLIGKIEESYLLSWFCFNNLLL